MKRSVIQGFYCPPVLRKLHTGYSIYNKTITPNLSEHEHLSLQFSSKNVKTKSSHKTHRAQYETSLFLISQPNQRAMFSAFSAF